MKKILQVIERFNVAGAEVVVRDLLLNLSRSRWDTEVCVLHDIGVLGRELKEHGYPIHYLNWEEEKLTDIQVIIKLNRLIKKRNIDLIHAHNATPWYFSTLASLPFAAIKRCVTIHGFMWGANHLRRKILYAALPLLTSEIILVSDAIRKQFQELPFFNMNKLRTIINGVNVHIAGEFDLIEKRKSIGVSEEDFVLGTVSRAYPEKNIEMQIELIHALLPEIPNIKLVVVAKKYDHFRHLEALVNRLKVQNSVIFTDERRDVPEMLKTFDIFIMTSFSEGTCLALLEAMASGLPVVVSDVGGNGGVVTHEDNGILFDVHNPDALKRHILTLYHHKEKRQQLARRAEDAGKSYSVENMVNQYDRVYGGIFNLSR
jgi:glycosyltransferase involved in cell wall biosynthesis